LKVTAFISHHDCARHDPGWNHPDHQGRLPGLMREVYRDMLTLHQPLLEGEGRHATEEELRLVHREEYLARVRAWVAAAEERGVPIEVRPQLVASAATWDASRAAVGCALAAVDAVAAGKVRNAFCAVRPPARDADAGTPGRFGFTNPLAIAARYLIDQKLAERVLIVEWGESCSSAPVLAGDAAVRIAGLTEPPTGSDATGAERLDSRHHQPPGDAATDEIHEGDCPPLVAARGQLYLADLPPNASGVQFLARLTRVLDSALHGFSPDYVLLSTGLDWLSDDPLGGHSLTPHDYFLGSRLIRQIADGACEGRLVSILEGGYEAAGLGSATVQHLRALAGLDAAA
jgi:acetoin utilization deacetylase AcuC-like enzyme